MGLQNAHYRTVGALGLALALAGAAEPAKPGGPDAEPGVRVLEKDRGGCTWVESSASVAFGEDDTRHQARAMAVARARTQAMNRFLGIDVRHQFMDFEQASLKGEAALTESLLRVTQLGRILDEKTLAEGPEDAPGCRACRYRVQIQTCIVPQKEDADKGFQVELTLNRKDFVDGDEASVEVMPTRDAYVYLFNVDMERNATLLFPNDYARDNKVKAGESLVYPGEAAKRDLGLRLVAQLPEGAKVSAETLRVIASKEPLPARVLKAGEERRKGAVGESETRGGGNLMKLLRKLNAEPIEWVDDAQGFTISKRD
ncbi:MAG: DUF4384 domain-containing protein [Elusimicrobia bacterium]|nr:DUF4384 domain-containing protein [Elusimicrobiota bacterium]